MTIPTWLVNTLNKIFSKSGYILCVKSKPYLPWPTASSTVDVAIVDPYKNQILLGKKRATGKWCIIGGFTDPISNCDAEDVVRELEEETGIVATVNDLRYIGDFKIPDGRYENTPHAIRTHYFILKTRVEDVKIGPTAPKDPEIETTAWFSLDERYNMIETPNAHQHLQGSHKILLTALKNYIGA